MYTLNCGRIFVYYFIKENISIFNIYNKFLMTYYIHLKYIISIFTFHTRQIYVAKILITNYKIYKDLIYIRYQCKKNITQISNYILPH